ncbi:MAG: response regulator [Chlorobiaceae bacterium]|nr:response regulator [Chlorobiaceae bacterium]NTV61411.1 response regulator [Chlorobiaceae bacterium]
MQKLKQKAIELIEQAEPNIPVIGMFATIGYPLFYVVWKDILPQPYESLEFRLLEAVISLPWLFYRFLPKKVKDYFPLYFLFSVPLLLPFFFFFMTFENAWSLTWALSTIGGLVLLIILVYDWRIICVMLVFSFFAAYGAVWALEGEVRFTYFRAEYIPTFFFALFGGLIINHRKQAAHKSKISLLRSLSGSIAHEMRNPLSSITNAIATVQASLPRKPDGEEEQERYDISHTSLTSIHHVIEESSFTLNRANKIIDSILTSMQGGEVATAGFIRNSSSLLMDTVVKSYPYSDTAERTLVTVTKKRDFDFLGDRDLFFYVLFNLMKNALYYKDKHGFSIEITTDGTDSENWIRVRDTGPGIPAGRKEKIFESFYTNKKGGFGLGLSFCRRVVESFGGTISCDSREGEWTEFTITLPKYDSKIVTEIKNRILRKKRVLIVDDQLGNRLIIAKFLSEMNCQFDQAENGNQALALISENRYDLIFMDFEMPFLNGDSVVKMIRSAQDIDPALALHYLQAPVVGVTALPEQEAGKRGKKSGMNEVLSKPVKRSDIKRIVEKYFFSEISSIRNTQEEVISGKRILLVDDNKTSRKFMSMVLNQYGCITEHALNGRDAIEMLEKESFDLVLMDIQMPVMDGIEAAKAIRGGKNFVRFTSFSRIPIIALTGNTDEKSVQDIRNAGMNYMLGKPVFKDELLSAIAVMLKHDTTEEKPMNKTKMTESGHEGPDFWSKLEIEKVLDPSTINGLREIGGDELLGSLFETYILDTDKLTGELNDACEKRDIEQVDYLTHTLKGSSGSVGANKMHVLCKYLNELARRGEWPEKAGWLDILKKVYADTVQDLQRYIRLEKT